VPASAYIQSVAFFVLAAVALFAAAGTVAIVTYWVYLAILAAVFPASFLWLDPDLARERMRPGGKKPPLALRLFSGVLFVHWVIAGLDHGRFHWSDSVPTWLQWTALIAVAAGYAFCFWAMRVNRFFSSIVRIQNDRGQVVITTGPYVFIRHPGYLAGIVIVLAWSGARLLDRRGHARSLHFAVSPVSRRDGGPCAARRIAGLSQLRGAGALAAAAGNLVRKGGRVPRGGALILHLNRQFA
jgi:protein-S-isoprenylcysteine O-methyltransferase Ste14